MPPEGYVKTNEFISLLDKSIDKLAILPRNFSIYLTSFLCNSLVFKESNTDPSYLNIDLLNEKFKDEYVPNAGILCVNHDNKVQNNIWVCLNKDDKLCITLAELVKYIGENYYPDAEKFNLLKSHLHYHGIYTFEEINRNPFTWIFNKFLIECTEVTELRKDLLSFFSLALPDIANITFSQYINTKLNIPQELILVHKEFQTWITLHISNIRKYNNKHDGRNVIKFITINDNDEIIPPNNAPAGPRFTYTPLTMNYPQQLPNLNSVYYPPSMMSNTQSSYPQQLPNPNSVYYPPSMMSNIQSSYPQQLPNPNSVYYPPFTMSNTQSSYPQQLPNPSSVYYPPFTMSNTQSSYPQQLPNTNSANNGSIANTQLGVRKKVILKSKSVKSKKLISDNVPTQSSSPQLFPSPNIINNEVHSLFSPVSSPTNQTSNAQSSSPRSLSGSNSINNDTSLQGTASDSLTPDEQAGLSKSSPMNSSLQSPIGSLNNMASYAGSLFTVNSETPLQSSISSSIRQIPDARSNSSHSWESLVNSQTDKQLGQTTPVDLSKSVSNIRAYKSLAGKIVDGFNDKKSQFNIGTTINLQFPLKNFGGKFDKDILLREILTIDSKLKDPIDISSTSNKINICFKKKQMENIPAR